MHIFRVEFALQSSTGAYASRLGNRKRGGCPGPLEPQPTWVPHPFAVLSRMGGKATLPIRQSLASGDRGYHQALLAGNWHTGKPMDTRKHPCIRHLPCLRAESPNRVSTTVTVGEKGLPRCPGLIHLHLSSHRSSCSCEKPLPVTATCISSNNPKPTRKRRPGPAAWWHSSYPENNSKNFAR